jgi:hypothetical protein
MASNSYQIDDSPALIGSTIMSIEKPCASISASVQPSCWQPASNSSARRRSGWGPWRRWRGWGMEQWRWCLVGALKDIRRSETVRGRKGMPSTARSESFEAVDVHGVAWRRSSGEQARHHRGRACALPLARARRVRTMCCGCGLAALSAGLEGVHHE